MAFSRNLAVIGRGITYAGVVVLVLVALTASIGRYYLPYISEYRSQILEWSSARAGFDIKAGALQGSWSKLAPAVAASDVHLGPAQGGIRAGSVQVELDLLRSLRYRQPLVSRITIVETQIQLQEAADGSWQIAQDFIPQDADAASALTPTQRQNIYNAFEYLDISDSSVTLLRHNGSELQIEHINLQLIKQSNRWRIVADGMPHNSALPVNVVLEGRGIPNSSDFTLRAHASFQGLDISGLAATLSLANWRLQLPNISGELWLDWADNFAVQAQGSVDARSAILRHSDGVTTKALQQLHSDFLLDMSDLQQIGVWLDDLHVELGEQRVAIDRAWLRREQDVMAVSVDAIALAPAKYLLTELGLMPAKPQEVLDTLNPTGWLRDVSLWLPAEESERPVQIRARLDQVDISAWAGAPGGSGISGYLATDLRTGVVSVAAEDFSLHFPRLYRRPLSFDSAIGTVAWTIDDESVTVQSSPLQLLGPSGEAHSYFDLDIPLQKSPDSEPQMNLVVGLRDTSAKFRNDFIPYTVGEELLGWLDKSIKQGDILDGGFIYRGSIAAKADLARSIQLYFNVENGEVDYDSRWPQVSQVAGEIFIDDALVRVDARRGAMLGLNLSDSTIEYAPAPTKGSLLTINSAISGGVAAALNVIKQSPVRDFVGNALDAWEGAGNVNAQLTAALPFGGDTTENVEIEAQLQGAAFSHAGLNLEFDQIAGPLHYTTRRQLYSPGLNGQLWGKALKASVNSTKLAEQAKHSAEIPQVSATPRGAAVDNSELYAGASPAVENGSSKPPAKTENWKTVIKLDGRADSSDILNWLNAPLQDYIGGSASYTARLSIAKSDSRLRISSDLEQLQSGLPAPLQKDEGVVMPLNVSLYLSDDPMRLAVRLEERARLALVLHDDQPASGAIGLGGDAETSYHSDRLAITGGLEFLDLGPWLEVLAAFTEQQGESGADTVGKVAADGVSIGRLNVYGTEFDAIKLAVDHSDGDWRFQVSSDNLAGKVGYNAARVPALSLDLQNLYLPAAEKPAIVAGEEGAIDAGLLDEFYPADLPAMNFSVRDFKVGDTPYGSWSFTVENIEHGIELHGLVAKVKGVGVGGEDAEDAWLQWRRVDSQQQTRFKGVLSCGDLGKVLGEWGFAAPIRSKQATFIPDLSWYGSPLQFGMDNLEGDVSFSMSDGQFLEDSSAANALRLFSIFNFDTILRRLQFNFKDVFNRGLSYDRIRGGFHIENGKMEIVDTLTVRGPSSRFQMTGTVDLENELVDTKMIATLPLTSNLPWVAALAGGLPAAAGVYVAGKIFQEQFDKLSSASYTIKGKWDDPKITLERIFDDKMKAKKGRTPAGPGPATPR